MEDDVIFCNLFSLYNIVHDNIPQCYQRLPYVLGYPLYLHGQHNLWDLPVSWYINDSFNLSTIQIEADVNIHSIFSLYRCYSQPNGSYTLKGEPSITCFEGKWNQLLAGSIIGILGYDILIPASFAYIVFRVRDRTSDSQFNSTFGYLTRRWDKQYYWWQLVIMARKLLISFAITTFAVTIDLQVRSSRVLSSIFLCWYLRILPE